MAAAVLEQSAESSPLCCWWMEGWTSAHQYSQLAVKAEGTKDITNELLMSVFFFSNLRFTYATFPPNLKAL